MRILLLAGEESGAMYAQRIRDAVLAAHPSAEIRGYGDYGFDIGDLAVIGFIAVLRRIFYFLRVKRTLERAINDWRPDVVCTIDYPGMNLKLAAYAKAHGIRAVHVVCPQVWAWRRGRIPKIEAAVDKLCCFFPFEPGYFRAGFAEFVGHPLLDEMSAEGNNRIAESPNHRIENADACRRLPNNHTGAGDASRQRTSEEDRSAKILAVLPGSRMGEIERHMPTLLEVVGQLLRFDGGAQMSGEDAQRSGGGQQRFLSQTAYGLRVIIPAANEKAYAAIRQQVRCWSEAHPAMHIAGATSDSVVQIVRGGARDALRRADAAVVASGTATLEAAIANCPTVLVYRVGRVSAALFRRLIRGIAHIGLANIIAEKAGAPCPMPELLQERFTADNVLTHLRPWLTNPNANADARRQLAETMRLLKSDGGAIAKIAACLTLDAWRKGA